MIDILLVIYRGGFGILSVMEILKPRPSWYNYQKVPEMGNFLSKFSLAKFSIILRKIFKEPDNSTCLFFKFL